MIKKLFVSILFIMGTFQGFANELSNQDRIKSLLPEGLILNIEPYIPSDFVLVQSGERECFWMPEGLYEKYIADSKSKHRPFIHVIPSGGSKENKGKNPVKEWISEARKYFPVHSSSFVLGKL